MEKTAKKLTFQDKRYNQLISTAKDAIKAGQTTIYLWGVSITVAPGDDGALENLMTLVLNGKRYSITDCLKDKAAVAKDGLLGSFCIEWGTRESQEVAAREAIAAKYAAEREQRKAEYMRQNECRKKAKAARKSAWGQYADLIWAYNIRNAHPEVLHDSFRNDVLAAAKLLSSATAMNGKLPRDINFVLEHRIWRMKIRTRVQKFWEQVCDLAELIYESDPVDQFWDMLPDNYEQLPPEQQAAIKAEAEKKYAAIANAAKLRILARLKARKD